jgi:pimeloyl-ACP methyl ester carboxylesterase
VWLFYARYGKTGIPVVLLEGGGDTIHDFAYLVPALSPHYRVIVLDARLSCSNMIR